MHSILSELMFVLKPTCIFYLQALICFLYLGNLKEWMNRHHVNATFILNFPLISVQAFATWKTSAWFRYISIPKSKFRSAHWPTFSANGFGIALPIATRSVRDKTCQVCGLENFTCIGQFSPRKIDDDVYTYFFQNYTRHFSAPVHDVIMITVAS